MRLEAPVLLERIGTGALLAAAVVGNRRGRLVLGLALPVRGEVRDTLTAASDAVERYIEEARALTPPSRTSAT